MEEKTIAIQTTCLNPSVLEQRSMGDCHSVGTLGSTSQTGEKRSRILWNEVKDKQLMDLYEHSSSDPSQG